MGAECTLSVTIWRRVLHALRPLSWMARSWPRRALRSTCSVGRPRARRQSSASSWLLRSLRLHFKLPEVASPLLCVHSVQACRPACPLASTIRPAPATLRRWLSTSRAQPVLRIGRTSVMPMTLRSLAMTPSLLVHPHGTQVQTQSAQAPAGTSGCTTPSPIWISVARRWPSSESATRALTATTSAMLPVSFMISSLARVPRSSV
mmetsp:Transcript_11626/g.20091  ORF Transcript_11626/g.20091 Transcript_11626/m.20091 type:complete len:205 (+) Transcript_11626:118-732(+)